jgi:hypothetical protein
LAYSDNGDCSLLLSASSCLHRLYRLVAVVAVGRSLLAVLRASVSSSRAVMPFPVPM